MLLHLPEQKAIKALKNWVEALHENAASEWLEYHVVEEGIIYTDDNLTVFAVKTYHLRTISRMEGEPCSLAFILEFKKEHLRILHTGDLSKDFSDFPIKSFEESFDLCLCEATHYNPETAIEIMKKANFKRLLFIHVGDAWHIQVCSGWNVENGEKRLLNLCNVLPYPVQIAHDGDEYWV